MSRRLASRRNGTLAISMVPMTSEAPALDSRV